METDAKETRIMKTDTGTGAENIAGSELMNDVKQRLSELQELLEENYITENEYAAARANVLLDAGVDIVVRPRSAEPKRIYRLEARSRRAAAGRDYGRFLIPGLLIAGALVCAAFFFWMLSEGGLFPARREELLPSILPLPSVPSVRPSEEAGGSDAESEDSGEAFFAASETFEPADPGSADPEISENSALPETLVPSLDIGENIPDVLADEQEESASRESGSSVWGVVSVRRVRIRAAPDTSAENVLGWALKGERYPILGESPGKDGSKWYNVRYEKIGREGWIKASMIEFE